MSEMRAKPTTGDKILMEWRTFCRDWCFFNNDYQSGELCDYNGLSVWKKMKAACPARAAVRSEAQVTTTKEKD